MSPLPAQTRETGFSYLETFPELRAWTPSCHDAIQIANTPLFRRPPPTSAESASASESNDPKANLMLIHDYQGGYNAYEAASGTVVGDAEESYYYRCEYLHHVETFVYFSHKLVTVPPPTWINACHRQGVRVLGTFIVEPHSRNVEWILERDGEGRFWVADRLAAIAKTHRFDGWLINIEKSFPLLAWSKAALVGFLTQLRSALGPGCQVCW